MAIRIFDSETGERIDLNVPGERPKWSPTGEWIAYLSDGARLHIMRPDGSDRRRLAGGMDTHSVMSWSPDGQWLVITYTELTNNNIRGPVLALVSVPDGELLPIRLLNLRQPSWRP